MQLPLTMFPFYGNVTEASLGTYYYLGLVATIALSFHVFKEAHEEAQHHQCNTTFVYSRWNTKMKSNQSRVTKHLSMMPLVPLCPATEIEAFLI